jgi:uncharacterized protein YjeT (DUF2065 family)
MNAVGIVSIVVGVIFIISRGCTLIAPAQILHWFRNIAATNRSLRILGAPFLILGLMMIWASSSEDTGLATILYYTGILFTGMSTILLLLFPSAYRSMVESLIPEDTTGVINYIRLKSLAGVVIGVLFIYYGALAL